MIIFNTLIFSIIISCFFSYIVFKFGISFGLGDIPNKRSSHNIIIPRGGGIGIPLALFAILLFFVKDLYLIVYLSITLSFFLLIDDKINLPASLRFFVEFGFALTIILYYRNDLIEHIRMDYGLIFVIVLIFVLSIIITSATNFFNFMDGIDGLAGFIAAISFAFLAYYAVKSGNHTVFLLSLSVTASTLGFLIFNFPKAKVFMGDVGSIFLGFLFASLVIIVARDFKYLLVLLSFQSVVYIDCIFTILIRCYRRENIFKGHLMHLYQRLVHKAGWSHPKVTIIYSLVQTAIGIIALIFSEAGLRFFSIFYLFLFFLYFLIRKKNNFL